MSSAEMIEIINEEAPPENGFNNKNIIPTGRQQPHKMTPVEEPISTGVEEEKIKFNELPRRNSIFHGSRGFSQESRLNEVKAAELESRLRNLVSAFSDRTKQTKAEIKRPPTPSTEESDSDVSSVPDQPTNQLQILAPDSINSSRKTSFTNKNCCIVCCLYVRKICRIMACNYILDPQGRVYVGWLAIVSILFLYNAWSIPLRGVFPYQTAENVEIWFQLDIIADLIYLLDILLFKSHYKFIRDGFWVKRPVDTWIDYIKSKDFYIDLGALFPLDIIFAYYYINIPWLRLPRLLKIATFWELFRRLDNVLASPHAARIARTILYMLYMIHLNGAAYYALSKWEGINATEWTYDGDGNAYIRCFYFATKTATSIGKNPKPVNEIEYIFMTVAWLSGVFIFAVLIGQVRDIVATATKALTDYQVITGATINYLHRFDVPNALQDRVKLWLTYTWEQQKTLDEGKILAYLPQKMQADLALHVHIETLSKVKLFHNCEAAFLRDLVVKLRSIIFLPGDYVIRKGEVGKEMYIVRTGFVNVIGGASGTQILATLGAGSAFGEIALLAIGGMTKRTADARSAGFSNLFVLSKTDLNQAIKDYPLAQAILRRKAKKLIKESMRKEKEEKLKIKAIEKFALGEGGSSGGDDDDDPDKIIIKDKAPAPKLLTTLLKAMNPDSKTIKYLRYGSKANSFEGNPDEQNEPKLPSEPPTPFMAGSVSCLSDSSDELYPSLPYEGTNVLDVWQDDDSDDVFFRRKHSIVSYNNEIMQRTTFTIDKETPTTATTSGTTTTATPTTTTKKRRAPDIPSFIVHPSTPNESDLNLSAAAFVQGDEPSGGNQDETRQQQQQTEPRQSTSSSAQRNLVFRRQLSVRGDDTDADDDGSKKEDDD